MNEYQIAQIEMKDFCKTANANSKIVALSDEGIGMFNVGIVHIRLQYETPHGIIEFDSSKNEGQRWKVIPGKSIII